MNLLAPLPKDPAVMVDNCATAEQQWKAKQDERRRKQQKLHM